VKRRLALAVSVLVVEACAPAPVASPAAPPSIATPPEHAVTVIDLRDAGAEPSPAREAAADERANDEDQDEVPAPAPPANTDARPGNARPPTTPDPLAGAFTLADATAGLPKNGKLTARIVTDRGTLRCALFEDRAPVTVAAFVGLARGLRPWFTPDGRWEKRAAYDGTTFHRVVRGFMIQGGDPWADGTGEPGFVFDDEPWAGAKHDRAGLLCIANRGPNTNGMQFFITDAPAPHLDGAANAYTIFGECSPLSLVHELASVPVEGTKPNPPLRIRKVRVERRAK
jgi:peptidyl-prolyl cis-trans isomerase A (cyclophilin A)